MPVSALSLFRRSRQCTHPARNGFVPAASLVERDLHVHAVAPSKLQSAPLVQRLESDPVLRVKLRLAQGNRLSLLDQEHVGGNVALEGRHREERAEVRGDWGRDGRFVAEPKEDEVVEALQVGLERGVLGLELVVDDSQEPASFRASVRSSLTLTSSEEEDVRVGLEVKIETILVAEILRLDEVLLSVRRVDASERS